MNPSGSETIIAGKGMEATVPFISVLMNNESSNAYDS
jgi:hypothetical protein